MLKQAGWDQLVAGHSGGRLLPKSLHIKNLPWQSKLPSMNNKNSSKTCGTLGRLDGSRASIALSNRTAAGEASTQRDARDLGAHSSKFIKSGSPVTPTAQGLA
jgi:hypothetical protein